MKKNTKIKKFVSLLLCTILTLGCMSVTVMAKGLNQIKNGEMTEVTNDAAITYWFPKYISSHDDNTVTYSNANSNIGGRTINRYNNTQYALVRTNASSVIPVEAAIEQLMMLPNGTYTLTAQIASLITDADKEAGAYAKAYVIADDGDTVTKEIDITTTDSGAVPWKEYKIEDVKVTNGRCRIGFGIKSDLSGTNASAGRAIAVDNVTFIASDSHVLSGKITLSKAETVPSTSNGWLADVIVINSAGETIASGAATKGGVYSISVPEGSGYTVKVSKLGYTPQVWENVTINEDTTHDFQFKEKSADLYTWTGSGLESYPDYGGKTYYFSTSGDDSNDGLSPETPWRSRAKFNATTFQPGDQILFKSGDVWTENLTMSVRGSGTQEQPITLGKYGGDALPVINNRYAVGTPRAEMSGNGQNNTFQISGNSYWNIYDLEITNFGPYDEYDAANGTRKAIAITSASPPAGQSRVTTTRGLVLNGLYVHDCNGTNPKNGSYGITWNNSGQSRIDGLTIENCLIKNISRNALNGGSITPNRVWNGGQTGVVGPGNDSFRHLNVVIRNNVLDTITGDGIVAGGTLGLIVEHNLLTKVCYYPVTYDGQEGYPSNTGNARTNLSAAAWPFDADNTIFQYNEVCYTGTHKGTEVADGQAFDADYYSINSLYQYNYTHDNAGGFLMVCGPAYSYSDGVVARYNISVNDGSLHGKRSIFEIGGGGGVDHLYIYNNTIYTSPEHSVFSVVRGEVWDGKPKGCHFYNNIFDINGYVAEFGWAGDLRDKGLVSVVEYSHNLYNGTLFDYAKDIPEDNFAVFGDPKFVNPVGPWDGYEKSADFKIQDGSAAIGKGMKIDTSILGQRLSEVPYGTGSNKETWFHLTGPEYDWEDFNGGHDFFGNLLPLTLAPDIGAHQLSEDPEKFSALAEIDAEDDLIAKFSINNNTEDRANVLCIVASYDIFGGLLDIKMDPVEVDASTGKVYTIEDISMPDGVNTVKAFIWRMLGDGFDDSYIPVCPAGIYTVLQ